VRDASSTAFRDAAPPGSIWWTDISNTRPEDFDGNVVSRLFSEERTGYAITYYSARKDSATLVGQIAELAAWVAANVPGGELRQIRCDFAAEAVRQGHGDDIYTAGVKAFCAANPRVRVIPVAPHSPALNRGEGTWGRIHGGSMLNAARTLGYHTRWPEAIVVYMQGLNTPGRLTDPEGRQPGWQHAVGDQGDRDRDERVRALDGKDLLRHPADDGGPGVKIFVDPVPKPKQLFFFSLDAF
jgi:hypothetical protein